MKKQFVIFAVLLFGAVNAQSIKYGLTANLHQSSIVGIHDRSKSVFGGGIGVYADISLTPNDLYDSGWLYFTPQLEYATQGENAKVPNMDNQKFHNSYIGLPLYLKYFLRNQGYKSDIYFMAGPRLEVLVSDKRSGPVSLTAAQEQKIKQGIKPTTEC